jgi:hypothetical protein
MDEMSVQLDDRMDGWIQGKPTKWTDLSPMHNAQVCVFDGTYKITTTNYMSKTSLYTTFRMYLSGPWPLKILMFTLLVTREITTYS